MQRRPEEAKDDEGTLRESAGIPGFGPAASPERIGPYRILKEIGRGGQGYVYLAEDTRLKRQVAVKVLTNVGTLSDDALRRFRREAEVASKLDHPGICAIYDFGTVDRWPYIAMRYVPGHTLAERIDSARLAGRSLVQFGDDGSPRSETTLVGPRPAPEPVSARTLELVERVARIVYAAHQRGVIHRDLKPGNIMVESSGEPVILDFGLARDLEADESTLTASGEVFGTPAYMSPEQIRGDRTIDARTDVYALGVMLFELLTLRRPFEAPTRQALFNAVMRQSAPDPRKLNPAISRDLACVMLTALAPERNRRYQSAVHFADDLRRVRLGEPVLARPITPLRRLRSWARRNRALATALAAVVVAVLVGLAASLYFLGSARTTLREYERLADVKRLQDLRREADALWPARAEKAPAMSAWIARADRLIDTLPDHEKTLSALEAKGVAEPAGGLSHPRRTADGALGGSDSRAVYRFADTRDQWRHDYLDELVRELKVFSNPDPVTGIRANVKRRLSVAETIEKQSVTDQKERWERAIRSISNRTECPAYGGFVMKPQVGLVPLGRNAKTGLWEFVHLETAEPDASGQVDLAAHAHAPLPAKCGLVFVLVPGGSFDLGATRDDGAAESRGANHDPLADSSEAPVQRITLAPFLMSAYEMTQGQWTRVAGKNPSRYTKALMAEGMTIDDRHPVESVSVEEIERVLFRLGLMLPTEAQWEYAARAGTTTPWWTGEEKESLRNPALAANLADATAAESGAPWPGTKTWPEFRDGFVAHAPVGSLAPNPFGLYDVHGNVWEAVRDGLGWYDKHQVRPGDGLRLVDPEDSGGRIARGGSFAFDYTFARVSLRYTTALDYRNDDMGFRPMWPIVE